MKKLYNKKGKVHPSPSSPPPSIADPLALLPATIFTLTLALCDEDKQVLAYLISCTKSSGNIYTHHKATHSQKHYRVAMEAGGVSQSHPPMFQCDCFRCYTSFWARWDASPNRQLIHEIIEAYEEMLMEKKRMKNSKVKKERRKMNNNKGGDELTKGSDGHLGSGELGQVINKEVKVGPQLVDVGGGVTVVEVNGGESGGDDDEGCEVGMEKGTMRRLVGFIGDRIWGVWNRV